MARMQLKYCDVEICDGLSGTAAVDQDTTAPAEGDTTLNIDNVSLNTSVTDLVPIGARFTLTGETTTTQHVVTARTPTDSGPTTAITFSPALGAGTYADNDAITFLPQRLEFKTGDGDFDYTEKDEFNYELDRDKLDTVTEGADQPMEISMNGTFEYITTGTSQKILPIDALKGRNEASEWVSSSSDPCEPFAVDVVVTYNPPCTGNKKRFTFPDFRSESRNVKTKDGSVSISGKCNATEPIIETIT